MKKNIFMRLVIIFLTMFLLVLFCNSNVFARSDRIDKFVELQKAQNRYKDAEDDYNNSKNNGILDQTNAQKKKNLDNAKINRDNAEIEYLKTLEKVNKDGSSYNPDEDTTTTATILYQHYEDILRRKSEDVSKGINSTDTFLNNKYKLYNNILWSEELAKIKKVAEKNKYFAAELHKKGVLKKEELEKMYPDAADKIISGEDVNEEILNEAEKEAEKNDKKYPKFKMPNVSSDDREKGNLDDIISDANSFVDKKTDDPVNVKDIQEISQRIFGILSELAVGVAVIIGLILGIKLMLASVEEKAEAKKMMWVYLVGCVIAFGAFGIWKVVVEILEKL